MTYISSIITSSSSNLQTMSFGLSLLYNLTHDKEGRGGLLLRDLTFIQALFFYLPGWIWGQVEGDRVANVVTKEVLKGDHILI